MGLSNFVWELGRLSSPFLFLTSLVRLFGALLLLASSSLMSSRITDGLILHFPSLLSFPPPAVQLCCFLLWGYWPLSWLKEHTEDCGATLNVTEADKYELRIIISLTEQETRGTGKYRVFFSICTWNFMFKWLWGNLWPQLYIYIIENGRKKNIVII